jgi:mono/diheme cytochrome c family protein
LVLAVGGAALFVLLAADGAGARPETGFLPAFVARYPETAGSPLNACTLCHVLEHEDDGEVEYEENRFAEDWDDAGRDFAAVEARDSDGDGFSNIEEIRALTLPGDPSHNPASVTTTTAPPGATTTTAAPGSGGALYTSACAACHGPGGGDLVPTALSRSRLIGVTTNGTGGMPGFSGRLSQAEIASIADYLLAPGSAGTTTTTTAPGGAVPTTVAPRSGSAVYAASCGACHGAGGGDLAGRSLSVSGVAAVTSSGTSGMPGFSGRLSRAEIDAVARYVAGLGTGSAPTTTVAGNGATGDGMTPAERTVAAGSGERLFTAHCATCHGAGGGDGFLDEATMPFSEILGVLTVGTEGMPGFEDTVSPDDLMVLAGYTAMLASEGPEAAGYTEHVGSEEENRDPAGESESETEDEGEVGALGASGALVAGHVGTAGTEPSFVRILLVTGLLLGLAGLWGALAVRVVRVLVRR